MTRMSKKEAADIRRRWEALRNPDSEPCFLSAVQLARVLFKHQHDISIVLKVQTNGALLLQEYAKTFGDLARELHSDTVLSWTPATKRLVVTVGYPEDDGDNTEVCGFEGNTISEFACGRSDQESEAECSAALRFLDSIPLPSIPPVS